MTAERLRLFIPAGSPQPISAAVSEALSALVSDWVRNFGPISAARFCDAMATGIIVGIDAPDAHFAKLAVEHGVYGSDLRPMADWLCAQRDLLSRGQH